jgi:hypothetical protein
MMGHDTVYGRIGPSELAGHDVRIDVLAPIENEDQSGNAEDLESENVELETEPLHLNGDSIFATTLISKGQAVTLAQREFYDPSRLNHSEKTRLLQQDVRAARRACEKNGYVVEDESHVEQLAETAARMAARLRQELAGVDDQAEQIADELLSEVRATAGHVIDRLRAEADDMEDDLLPF